MLNVGITGHRAGRLPPGSIDMLPGRLEAVLRALAAAAAPTPPVLHTALATGADQLAATAARALGYRVHAVLPSDAADYAAEFADGAERAQFDAQHGAADRVTALTGRPGDAASYVAVGRAVIAASDVMLAVWDGARTIVPGGTAHVVAFALAAGRPVIHLHVGGALACGEAVLLRASFAGDEPVASALADDAAYARLVREVTRAR